MIRLTNRNGIWIGVEFESMDDDEEVYEIEKSIKAGNPVLIANDFDQVEAFVRDKANTGV